MARRAPDDKDLREAQARPRPELESGRARLLDLIFLHALDPLALLDKDFNFIRVSESYARAAGRRVEDFPGRSRFDLFPSSFLEEARRCRREKTAYCRSARPFVCADQPERGAAYWDVGLVPLLDERGEIECFLLTLKDVTESIRSGEALKAMSLVAQERARQVEALADSLVEIEQKERRRMAELLHDHLQQLLSAAVMQLGALLGPASGGAPDGSGLRTAYDLLKDAVEATRTLSGELYPPVLREAGLEPALEWLARRMRRLHGLEVELEARRGLPETSESVRTTLFGAARELLFNAVKHSGVRKAKVTLAYEPPCLRVEVSDEGAGFDPAALESRLGLGLAGIRERLALLSGRMEIESRPGGGSRFRLLLPLDSSRAAGQESVARMSLDSPPAGELQ